METFTGLLVTFVFLYGLIKFAEDAVIPVTCFFIKKALYFTSVLKEIKVWASQTQFRVD